MDDTVAADLLRRMQAEAGLTQSEWARRAGVSRPVLSAYQNGRRQPSVAMLARLARAADATITTARRPPCRVIDAERNGRRLLDALTLVDAMPVRRRTAPLARPVAW